MEPQYQQYQQPQPSPPIQRFSPTSLLNSRWIINGSAVLLLVSILWLALRPDKPQTAPEPIQPQPQVPVVQPQIQPVQPIQQTPAFPIQSQPAQPMQPTYETLQVQQAALPVQPIPADANEARYQELVQMYLFDNTQFNQIVAQYQGWVTQRHPGDPTAAAIIRMVDEGTMPALYPMYPKQ